MNTFPDHRDYATTLRQVVGPIKQPKETMAQYYFGKMNLLQACNIGGKDAVSCFIDGLVDRTFRNGVKAGRFESPEKLYAEYLSLLNTDTWCPQDDKDPNGKVGGLHDDTRTNRQLVGYVSQ
jgi:hypothetical protein